MLKKEFALLMILLLGFVLFNNTANRHQHVLPGGMIIEHAHPFSSCCSEGKGHEHNDLELLLFILISDSPFTAHNAVLSPLFIPCVVRELKAAHIQIIYAENSFSLSLLRAPPLA